MTDLARRTKLVLALAALAAVAGTGSASAQSAFAPQLTIDTFFNTPSGIARDDFLGGSPTETPWAVAVDDARNRILTVGEIGSNNSSVDRDVAIVARKRNGVPDTSFGPNDSQAIGGLADEGTYFVSVVAGKVKLHTTKADAETLPPAGIINLTPAPDQGINHSLRRPDGQLLSFKPSSVAAGGRVDGAAAAETIDLGLGHGLNTGDEVKYDTGFVSDGRVIMGTDTTPSGGIDSARSIVQLPDGRLRIVGETDVDPTGTANTDILLLGLTANGTPDPSFVETNFALPITGLSDDAEYFARVDGTKVSLHPTAADATANTGKVDLVNAAAARGNPHTLTRAAPALSAPFNPTGASVISIPNDTIELGAGHGLATGDEVTYDVGTLEFPGMASFKAGPGDDIAARVAVQGTRLAITGQRHSTTAGNSPADTFASLRNLDGTPVADFDDADASSAPGVVAKNLGGDGGNPPINRPDLGADIAFVPGGVVALARVASNPSAPFNHRTELHSFNDDGDANTAFAGDGSLPLSVPGGTFDTTPGGLLRDGGRLWVTGSTKRSGTANDLDAFLARVATNGTGAQYRRFDMRGRLTPADTSVTSHGADLALVPGASPTLVVGGVLDWIGGVDWAAAAFGGITGSVATMPRTDFAITAQGNHGLNGVATSANGSVAVTGGLTSNSDPGFGTARLLPVDTRRCDLSLAVPDPLELVFEGGRGPAARVQVRNVGTRDCSGVVTLGPPFGAGTIRTPTLGAGETFTTVVPVSYGGPRKAEDVAVFRLTASGDLNLANNTFPIRAVFNFCDLAVRPESAAGALPSEGSRVLEFGMSNVGTAPCGRVTLGLLGGLRLAGEDPYTLDPGRSVSDEIRVAAPPGAARALSVRLLFRGSADGDVNGANNGSVLTSRMVRVGDSNARRPRGRVRRFSGRARRGRGQESRRRLAVKRVHIAVLRRGRGCRWLASRRVRFRKLRPRAGRCDRRVWLRATGTRRWVYRLRRKLPRGRYILYSRVTIGAGFREARFSARDRNRIRFRAR